MEQINAFQILDPRFRRYVLPNALLEKLYSGARWAEGPVYFAEHHCLIFSDIPNTRMLRFDEQTSEVRVFRADSRYSNGNTRDRQGRLVTCEHGARRVTRTELDGSITVIVDRYEGKRLNSPNDVVVRSDRTIWFTDPTYGISAHYEGGKTESEIGSCNVYRFDPTNGSLRVVADDFVGPNGLAFSRDGQTLYVADSGFWSDPTAPRHIRSFGVTDDGRLTRSRVLIEVTPGAPDGLRVDVDDNVWAAAADGIHCIAPGRYVVGQSYCSGNVRKHVFWRPATQPSLHLRLYVPLCNLSELRRSADCLEDWRQV
jgi:gluconolactonase